MQAPRLSAEILTSLSKHDTPTVCNAIELFDVRPRTVGYMNENIHGCFPQLPPMVGYAGTAKFSASGSSSSYQTLVQQAEYITAFGAPTVVVFEDLDKPSVAATFGEIMCTAYQACGSVGLITSGAGRDIGQVEAIGFPVYVGSIICSHGCCSIVETDTPVQVGGISVHPGDLLHGDRNGVTTIPHEIASEIPGVCEKYMEAEKIVSDHLRGASFTVAGLAEAISEYENLLGVLKQSLRGK